MPGDNYFIHIQHIYCCPVKNLSLILHRCETPMIQFSFLCVITLNILTYFSCFSVILSKNAKPILYYLSNPLSRKYFVKSRLKHDMIRYQYLDIELHLTKVYLAGIGQWDNFHFSRNVNLIRFLTPFTLNVTNCFDVGKIVAADLYIMGLKIGWMI